MTKEQLIQLVKFTAGEIVAPTELSTEDAESIVDDFVEAEQLTIPVVMQRFIDVVQNDKKVFIGHLDEENYIEIQYVGWNSKGVKKYKIQVWRDECGCIYEEIKRFPNMDEAILCAVSNAA